MLEDFVKPCPFRKYVAYASGMEVVQASWVEDIKVDHPIIRVIQKLKRLRATLRNWSRNTFGILDQDIKAAQQNLSDIQVEISS